MKRMLLIPIALLLASCGGERAESAPPPAAPPASAPATAAAASAAGAVTIRADGKDVATIRQLAGDVVEISFLAEDGSKQLMRGEPRDSGKRKYRFGQSAVMFEVKPGDDEGFKLRTADGALRWKVKVAADKIKISDNEENKNPFELKLREGDRVKVVAPGEKELGNVRGRDVEDAAGRKRFTADGGSAALGVLLLDPIPAPQRYILVAELLSRGK